MYSTMAERREVSGRHFVTDTVDVTSATCLHSQESISRGNVHSKYKVSYRYRHWLFILRLTSVSKVSAKCGIGGTLLPDGAHGLCKKHYCELYNQVHQPVVCTSCGARSKAGKRFPRHWPNPSFVSKLLNSNNSADVQITLRPVSYICLNCYKITLFYSMRHIPQMSCFSKIYRYG